MLWKIQASRTKSWAVQPSFSPGLSVLSRVLGSPNSGSSNWFNLVPFQHDSDLQPGQEEVISAGWQRLEPVSGKHLWSVQPVTLVLTKISGRNGCSPKKNVFSMRKVIGFDSYPNAQGALFFTAQPPAIQFYLCSDLGYFLAEWSSIGSSVPQKWSKTRLVSKDSNFTIFYHISPISNSFTHFSLSSGITHQKNTKIAILDDVPSPCQKGFQQNWECLGVPNDPPKWKVHTENCLFSSIFWVTAAGKSTIFINLQSKFGDVRYAMVKSHSTKPYKIPLNHSKSY